MLFTITGKHIDITDGIRSHAEEKASKLSHYFNSITKVEVIVDGNSGGLLGVEVIASGEHNMLFVAKESGEDMYACLDIAVHKLERQLNKAKEKQRDNKHIKGAHVAEQEEEQEE